MTNIEMGLLEGCEVPTAFIIEDEAKHWEEISSWYCEGRYTGAKEPEVLALTRGYLKPLAETSVYEGVMPAPIQIFFSGLYEKGLGYCLEVGFDGQMSEQTLRRFETYVHLVDFFDDLGFFGATDLLVAAGSIGMEALEVRRIFRTHGTNHSPQAIEIILPFWKVSHQAWRDDLQAWFERTSAPREVEPMPERTSKPRLLVTEEAA